MYAHYTAFNLNRPHISCLIDGLNDGHELIDSIRILYESYKVIFNLPYVGIVF